MTTTRSVLAALLCLSAASPALAGDDWQFSVTPYLWAPNINGTLKYAVPSAATGSPEVRMGPSDYLEHLDFGLMLSAEARRGEWSLFTDLIHLRMSAEQAGVRAIDFAGIGRVPVSSSLDTGTEVSLSGTVWTLAAGYAVPTGGPVSLDVFGGFRYFGLKTEADWALTASIGAPAAALTFARSGEIRQRADLWDAIVGVRGRIALGDGWSLPYYLDAGTGDSRLTWQAAAGVVYAVSWGEASLTYRHLAYDQDGDKFVQELRFSGPMLGASFRF